MFNLLFSFSSNKIKYGIHKEVDPCEQVLEEERNLFEIMLDNTYKDDDDVESFDENEDHYQNTQI